MQRWFFFFTLFNRHKMLTYSHVALRFNARAYLNSSFECLNSTAPGRCEVNIASGDGFVPSGNKPSPESMLTYIRHMASLGHNEF